MHTCCSLQPPATLACRSRTHPPGAQCHLFANWRFAFKQFPCCVLEHFLHDIAINLPHNIFSISLYSLCFMVLSSAAWLMYLLFAPHAQLLIQSCALVGRNKNNSNFIKDILAYFTCAQWAKRSDRVVGWLQSCNWIRVEYAKVAIWCLQLHNFCSIFLLVFFFFLFFDLAVSHKHLRRCCGMPYVLVASVKECMPLTWLPGGVWLSHRNLQFFLSLCTSFAVVMDVSNFLKDFLLTSASS